MEIFDLRDEFENALAATVDFLPNLLAAVVIVLVGALIAAGLAALVRKALQKLRFDRALHGSPAGNYIARVVDSPSQFTGRVVYWLILLGAISMAIAALQLPLIDNFLGAIYSYIPNIVGAVVIFLVATVVSAGATGFIQRIMGRTSLSRMISAVVPAVTMSLAVFMILNQLGIATDIVNILFTAIVGSIALGLALAFGLGGRDAAKELLEQAADSARAHKNDVRKAVKK